MQGFLRKDGRKGIRNVVVVTYLVECAHHVAARIVQHFEQGARINSQFSILNSQFSMMST